MYTYSLSILIITLFIVLVLGLIVAGFMAFVRRKNKNM